MIIGEGGMTIHRIQAKSGARASIQDGYNDNGFKVFNVRGEEEQVKQCRKMISDLADYWSTNVMGRGFEQL